jgi:biopolymer transport protein ExbD
MHGSSSTRSAGTKKARIEIIPLIDVIFFLLATFVLFTLSLNTSGGLAVSLPTSASSQPRDPGMSVTLSIKEDGTLGWDKEPITLDQFIIRLQAFKQTQPDGRILINGDEAALFQQVRYVIDEVRKSGIAKVLIETRIRPAE